MVAHLVSSTITELMSRTYAQSSRLPGGIFHVFHEGIDYSVQTRSEENVDFPLNHPQIIVRLPRKTRHCKSATCETIATKTPSRNAAEKAN